MDGMKQTSPSAALLVERLAGQGFTLFDIGCNGGLHPSWEIFGDQLHAFAFDPAILEIERLSRAETRPFVSYIAGYVGLPLDHPLRRVRTATAGRGKNPWSRLSTAHALASLRGEAPSAIGAIEVWGPEFCPDDLEKEISEFEASRPAEPSSSGAMSRREVEVAARTDEILAEARLMRRNLWEDATLADPDSPIVPTEFLKSQGITDIDFIKIDVDGADYEVLHALGPHLEDQRVLGLSVEVNLQGSHLPHQHIFHNTDRFMRAHGFELFDLSIRRYSSAALPSPFLRPHESETLAGRPLQGDALYLRDFGWRQPHSDPADYSAVKIARLIILFCLFDLLDQAAETAIRFRDTLSELVDVDALLNTLAAESVEGEGPSYEGYMALFRARHPYFYDRERRRRWVGPLGEPQRPEQGGKGEASSSASLVSVKAGQARRPTKDRSKRLLTKPLTNLVPVSLGQTGEARFQIVRHLFKRFYPQEPENIVRWCVFDPENASYCFDGGLFDMQVTSPFAVCEYLEWNFEHIFDREDLVATGDVHEVANSRLQVTHPKLIPHTGAFPTEADLDAGYEAAARIMSHRVLQFRKQLESSDPRLYILSEAPDPETTERLLTLLGAKAHHPFHLLINTRSKAAADLLAGLPGVDVHLAGKEIGKPADHVWEGDDGEWDRALEKYDLARVLTPRDRSGSQIVAA